MLDKFILLVDNKICEICKKDIISEDHRDVVDT